MAAPISILQQQQQVIDAILDVFPDISIDWIRANAHLGAAPIIEYCLSNPTKVARLPNTTRIVQLREDESVESPQRYLNIQRQDASNVCEVMNGILAMNQFRNIENLQNLSACNEMIINILRNDFRKIALTTIRAVARVFKGNYAPAYAVLALMLIDNDNGQIQTSIAARFCDARMISSTRAILNNPHPIRIEIQQQQQIIADALAFRCTTSDNVGILFECEVCCTEFPLRRSIECVRFDSEHNDDGDYVSHRFCVDCIRAHADAISQTAMTKGGVGLPCMQPDCDGGLLWDVVRPHLVKTVRKRLSERLVLENVRSAGVILEYCKYCRFAMCIEVPKDVDKVFRCLKCRAQFCRQCERDWDDEHIGKKCEEVTRNCEEAAMHEYENKLSAAMIRRCTRCNLAFDKEEGCNKMVCRCGMTQCYLCREAGINYAHFCSHVRDPANPTAKCSKCAKSCLLWENAKLRDDATIEMIKKEAKNDARIAGRLLQSKAVIQQR